MNLTEKYLRAVLIESYLADAFARAGFKTEARKLKIQANATIKLISKAVDEMPKLDVWDSVMSALSGELTPKHRATRQKRGMHFARIGRAEKVMLKTLRDAFDSLYKTHGDWTRREQLNATSRMMKGLMESSKKKAQAMLAAAESEKK